MADLGQKCLGGLGGLEAWKDLEGSEGSGGLVGSEGLGGLEVQKFKVVRKVLVVWIQMVRGSDLLYSQFVFLRIGGFFNFSGNLGLM